MLDNSVWNEFEILVYKTVVSKGPIDSDSLSILLDIPYSTIYVALKRLRKANQISRWRKHFTRPGAPTVMWEFTDNQCMNCSRKDCQLSNRTTHEKCFSKIIEGN